MLLKRVSAFATEKVAAFATKKGSRRLLLEVVAAFATERGCSILLLKGFAAFAIERQHRKISKCLGQKIALILFGKF